MATIDLTSTDVLRALHSRFSPGPINDGYREWQDRLVPFLDWVKNTPESERATPDFQTRLWDDNPVSSAGRGTIPVDQVLRDGEFRKWLARVSIEPVPEPVDRATPHLDALYREIVDRIKPHSPKIPHLKIFRVLAALFPRHFTTVCDRYEMERLHRQMFGSKGESPVARHANVLRRLEEVLGPTPLETRGLVTRMTFPWYLLELTTTEEPDDLPPLNPAVPGQERLVPLPAIRRRRGLTALRGYLTTVVGALEFIQDGVSREELLAFLRAQHPDLKDNSLPAIINVLQGELAVIRRDGDKYVLNRRGQSLLESDDPTILAPWLLTRVLGVDHALVALRDHRGDLPRATLLATIRAANPGWTSGWMPTSMLAWLRACGLLDLTDDKLVRLTPAGTQWAARIDWTPEPLAPEEAPLLPTDSGVAALHQAEPTVIAVPPFEEIYEHIARRGTFDKLLVASLHAGLWANSRRHFAILTGLSGAGKTLLAMAYAEAVTAQTPNERQPIRAVPVQPGWSDSTSLVGYVNPLRPDTYVRTPFLDFLLSAAADPEHPYVAVLDEMNLSHPEQYLAPLLSAMETPGASIDLHREGDVFDGVPASIPYPSNLVLIGTVNMDETTHGLSDKVLDRALTLEFWEINVDAYPRWGQHNLPADAESKARQVLKDLGELLAPARLHFGWRVIDDVLNFFAKSLETGASHSDVLDMIVLAKIVPKLRGDDSARFRDALTGCGEILRRHGLNRAAKRVADLLDDLKTTGTARFWR